jgi:hypothetical protein
MMKTMMKLTLLGSMLIPYFTYSSLPQKKDTTETIECLKIIGLAVDEDNRAIDGVEIKLFKQNDVVEEIELTNAEHHEHSFTFILESNEYYTVKISKPGFVDRCIAFYTTLPSSTTVKSLFYYEFEVILFKEKKMDDYYLDFPVAIVHYNEKNKAFECNAKYTKYIKTKIKEAEDLANPEKK